MAKLKEVSLDVLDDHPDNPRLVFRDEVIDGIVANLDGEWPQQYALHVRPVGKRYQILSGHTRKRAAQKKELKSVWAWVEEMDDAAAYMLLATSNNQGELSPLEIGLHALKAVPRSEGGRGKKGGLSEYADKVGKTQQLISQYRLAAEVAEYIKPTSQLVGFLDKAQHLAAIHKLPKGCWQVACENLGKRSAADTREWVEEVQAVIEERKGEPVWCVEYLRPVDCANAVLCGKHKGGYFSRLTKLADAVHESLADHEDLQGEWRDWLEGNAGGDSWILTRCQEKRSELEEIAWGRNDSKSGAGFFLGDFQKVAEKQIKDNSVELIFTDPPYFTDNLELYERLAEVADAKLMNGGSLITYCGHRLLPKVFEAMNGYGLSFYWPLACIHTGEFARMPITGQIVTWKPMLWFVKGSQRFDPSRMVRDSVESTQEKGTHEWQQSLVEAKYYIENLTTKNGLVFDPFCGGGTTAIAASQLGRRFITTDCDEKALASAKERFDGECKG